MMLPRVAGALFDIGREIERMDHGARVLEVAGAIGVGRGVDGRAWSRLAEVSPRGPESVARSARIARSRADTVRGHLPPELWEAVNDAHIELRGCLETEVEGGAIYGFSLSAHRAAHLVFGVADQAMRRDGLWHYLRLGRFLERAGATTRLLAAAAAAEVGEDGDPITPAIAVNGTGTTTLGERDWRAVLEATFAYHAFLRSGATTLDDRSVVRFLLLDGGFPRSVAFSLGKVAAALSALELERALAPSGAAAEATVALLTSLDESPPEGLEDLLELVPPSLHMIEAAVSVDCLPHALDDPGGLHDAQAAHQTQN
jgi:uncharacterized alpha-E superfamily protein